MLTLQTFGPGFGLRDTSPFVVKTMTLLKLSGLSHELEIGNVLKTPKGKLPVLKDNDKTIPDSTFIKWHLEEVHGIDFDPGLSTEQKIESWAIEKMLEDHLYWTILYERWMIDENFNRVPKRYFDILPAPVRPFISWSVRRQMKRNLHGHGMGRHTRDDITDQGCRDIDALAAILGDKPYVFGDRPTSIDAAAYAFIGNCVGDSFTSKLKDSVVSHTNLVAFLERIDNEVFGGSVSSVSH